MIIGQMRFRHIKKEKIVEDAKREKERFEYLFLDLEWNQAPGTTGLVGREAIQIGVVAADTKIQIIKTFSKAIRLSDPNLFNEKTEIVTHTPVTNIMQGKEEDVVLTKFAKHFPEYRFLVVWNRDTYDLFLRDMRKNGILVKRHKPVFLQEVLSVITGNENDPIGFEKALTCAGIKYAEITFIMRNMMLIIFISYITDVFNNIIV